MGLSVQNGIFPDFPQGDEPAPIRDPYVRPPQARGRLVPTPGEARSETGTSIRRLLSRRGGYPPTIKDPIRPGDQSKDQNPPRRRGGIGEGLMPAQREDIMLRGRFEIGCQACSSSSSALASFKSSVSKPSVNQP